VCWVIVLLRATREIVRLANVQFTIRILQNVNEECIQSSKLAPAVGFEPTTNRLTADRSTTELRWILSLGAAEREFCPRDLRPQVLPHAQKMPLKTAAATAESFTTKIWLRGRDLNPRPSGYEPDELPGCSTPHFESNFDIHIVQIQKVSVRWKRAEIAILFAFAAACDFVDA